MNVINRNIRRKFYIIRTISSEYLDIFNIPRSFIFKLFPFVRSARTFVVNYHRIFYILHEIFRQTSISVRIQCLTFPLIRDTICMNYDGNRNAILRRTSDLQIQYFERLNPEMECIYLLERRYQAGEDAPHSIPALRDYLSGKYNIPMFELEAMLQPLIDLENYVVSNLQVSEERLRFFFSSRGGTTSALARPLYAVLHSRPHYGSLPEAEKLGSLKRVLARVLGLETEDLAGIDSFDALIRFLLQSPASEDVKWICTALFYSIDDYMEELDIILRKATALFLEHVPDTAASLCRGAMKDAKAKIGDDPVSLFVNLNLQQRPERLTVVPSMMAFHGVQWDFAAETLYFGVYYAQLGDLIVKYSDQSASLVRRLKSIGDKSRLEILRAVKDGPCNGQDIAEKLSLAPATISHHMNLLCNEGLLTATRRGTSLYYEPDCENLSRFLRELEHYLL